MNFTQLRAFDAVAREGGFSRAAAQLSVTQPALSIQIKALEDSYGVKLIDRAGRTATLTEAGQALFEFTSRLFAVEQEAEDYLTASRELRHGHLRVAADGPHIVMDMFAQFRRRYPAVQLSVVLGNTAYVRQQLVERRVDVAILPGVGDDPLFERVELLRHCAVLVAPWTHRWARRRSISLAELHGEPMVMREEGSNTQRVLSAALERRGTVPRPVLHLGSREAVLAAVAADVGLGVVWEIEAVGDLRFKMIPIRDPDLHSTDFIACLKGERNRRTVRALMEIAKTYAENGRTVPARDAP